MAKELQKDLTRVNGQWKQLYINKIYTHQE